MTRLIECDRSYAPEILAIFNDAITNSTALYEYRPRTLDYMAAWFDGKRKGNYPVIGAADGDNRLLGFASYGPFRPHPAYKYTVEHSVYVAPASRSRGVGRLLLEAIVDRARQQGYHNVVGGIDRDNAVSIRLHERLGFEHCGTVRHAGFKFGRWLDLVFYQRLLDTPSQPVDG
ncbi:MAG: N-acetyltransferase family protein [Vicinamibacterales bacterium]